MTGTEMKEIKINETENIIIGLDKTDVRDCNVYIRILKNNVLKCEYSVDLIKRLGEIWFPDMPIYYNPITDKITIEKL